jgi:hypothetical protein
LKAERSKIRRGSVEVGDKDHYVVKLGVEHGHLDGPQKLFGYFSQGRDLF